MKPLDPRLLRHAGAARRFIVTAAALTAATAGLVMVQAQLLAGVLDTAFLGGAGLHDLGAALLGVLAVVAVRAGLVWAGELAAHRASTDVVRTLRSSLVAHVLRLGPRHPDLPPTGELATLATRGLDGLEGYFSRYLPTLLVAALVPAAVAIRILVADPLSGLIVALTVPLIPLFMILVGLHTQRSTRRQWRALTVLGHHFLDLVAGLDVLVAFGRARHQSTRLATLAASYRQATMRTLRIAFLSALVLELLATLSVALVAVTIGLRLVEGRLDLFTGLLVLVLAPEVYLPLRAVGARFHDAAEGVAAAEQVFSVLDLPASATSGRQPAPNPAQVPLRCRDVVVSGRGGRVLDGLNLELPPGRCVGLRGPSGAGKSTLLDLLLTLRTPGSGQITVGGVDLADLDRDAWLRRIAWVPQRPVLVTGDVAANIRLASPDAPDAAVAAAAAAAALDVPLDTPVGEDGTGLSTGQQRRVALARAVLADRPLLLLDEPTEGVDADTEAAIVAALPAITAGRTALIVSHRPAVLAACDSIVDLLPSSTPSPSPAAHPTLPGTGATTVAPAVSIMPPVSPVRATSVTDSQQAQAAIPARGSRPHSWVTDLGWSLRATRGQRARLALAAALGAAALGCGVALTATSAWLISAAALQPPVLTLMVAIVAVRAFGLGKGVLRYAERLVSHDAALRCGSALRVQIWAQLLRLGPAATARIRRGELLSRLVADVDAQQDLLIRALVPATAAATVGLLTAMGVGLLLPTAGLVIAAGLLVAGILAPAATAWAAHRTEKRTAAARGDVLARTVEIIDGAPDLLVSGAAAAYRHRLAAADTRLSALLRRAALARGLGSGLGVLGIGATAVAATAVGITALRDGTLPGPALALLALTPLALADVVVGLPDAAVRLLTALPAASRLAELATAPSPVTEPASSPTVAPPTRFTARNLAVRWPGADRDAVREVDMDLTPGTRLALVGPSGAGKSTVVATLLRTLNPSTGSLHADSRDVRTLAADDVRAGIAWCGARTHLFDSTLRANLLLAAPDATDDDLTDALRQAQLGAWLATLPRGLDTPIGQHGSTVSGGERQRLGIARAILSQRPVWMLDEPTAHLDAATADALATELMTLTSGRTALIVTHRPEQTPDLPQLQVAPQARLVPSSR